MKYAADQLGWALLRILLGFEFLWAFVDKLFGLGFATAPAKSWLLGNSPTYGFLAMGSKGWFASFYHTLAGNVLVDWLFMIGLLAIGLALLLGMGVKIAGYAGTLLVLLMWLAVFPPANNPLLDEHVLYAVILLTFTRIKAGQWYGLGEWWSNTSLVKKFPILE